MSKTTVCFDIGSKNLRMVVLEGEKGAFRVLDYAMVDLALPQNSPEDERNRIIARNIKNILTEKKIKTQNIAVSISGQAVFVRFVKLPAVEESKIKQIIRYEAQQQVPFPIEDVEWDHQIIGSKTESELDIALVAVRKEVIASMVNAITSQGIDVETVDVSTISLYNCLAANEEFSEQGTVLIDLGARTSNLLICVGDKLWARAIPIGGDNFTAALMKNLELDFEQSESLKRRATITVDGLPQDQMDDERMIQASELLTKVARRLYTEIARSVGYFRSQWPSVKLGRVLLTGGGSFMNNIQEFLSSKLKTEVEDFLPFNKVSPPLQADQQQLSQIGRQLTDAIGLGLRILGGGRLATNLLPETIVQRKELAKKRVYIAGALVFLIATLGWQSMKMKDKATDLENIKETLAVKLKTDEAYSKDIAKLERKHKDVAGKLEKIKMLQDTRLYWLDFIDILKKNKPKYVWFTSVQIIDSETLAKKSGLGYPGGLGYEPMSGMPPESPRRSPRSPSPGGSTRGRRGAIEKPKPMVMLKGYIKIGGKTGSGETRSQELSKKLDNLKEMLASIEPEVFNNVEVINYNQLRRGRNLGIFEIQAELVKVMPEY